MPAFALVHAADDFGSVVAAGLREDARVVVYRAALRVVCAEIETADAGEADGGRTHGAGFEGDIQIAVGKAFVF